MAVNSAPGLRERKKQETREALSWATLRLAVEHGIDKVLVEDIAAAAGVSPRTFNNYFSSKYDAITFRHRDRFERAAAALRERPPGEPLWEAITAAALQQFGVDTDSTPETTWTTGVATMMTDPAFVGSFLRAAAMGEHRVAEAIAERTGADVHTDLHPRLAAAAVSSAVRIASELWISADPPVAIGPLIRSALAQIAAGLPAHPTT
ncbi:TetR/AcrR family transcriptional regulator [Pseudonocardia sp. GCM10023141]|uniref:TetR/AcrR family transcriptional regulator n=1 Tax=Pseudonocardia sp. GCM10023141 TaxID=3252653 RepID=UPI003619FB66